MINTKTKGELGRRIEYDVEHDLFHPQNIYSDEYITPTFVEYVKQLEQKLEQAEKDLADYQFNYPTIKELEKENAELRAKWLQATDEGTSWAHRKSLEQENAKLKGKFATAKEIIKEFVEWANWQGNSKCPSFKSIQDKAEQFLNSEVEK